MKKIVGIYKIVNLINNKIYIGCSKNIYNRIRYHQYKLSKNNHENPYLQFSYNKYGKDNFEYIILEECAEISLLERENYWVNLLNCLNKNYGYNVVGTSNTNKRIISEETKKKMSNSAKNKIRTEEHCRNISKGKKGMIGPNLGKKHNFETRQKMRISSLGRKASEETKLKMSKVKKGIKPKNLKSLQKYSLNNIFICTYNSITEAALSNNISRTSILNNLKNRSKTAGKFIWKYEK